MGKDDPLQTLECKEEEKGKESGIITYRVICLPGVCLPWRFKNHNIFALFIASRKTLKFVEVVVLPNFRVSNTLYLGLNVLKIT